MGVENANFNSNTQYLMNFLLLSNSTVVGLSCFVTLMQVRPYMQDILVRAMNLRVATETLHPLYRLCAPQQVFDGVCLCPGIAVISDVFFAQQEPQIILQAEVESLQ